MYGLGEQSGVRCDLGAVKLQLQAAVGINPQPIRFRFTHRVRHLLCPPIAINHLIIIHESPLRPAEFMIELGNAGL